MPKRDESHMAARRKQILDAASASINQKGIAGMSISDISAAAGLSVGAIYTHFKSKEDILAALISHNNDVPSMDLFIDCRTKAATLARIKDLLHQVERPSDATLHGRIAIEVVALAHRSPRVQDAVETQYLDLRRAVLDQVKRLQTVPDPAAAAHIGDCLLGLMLTTQFQQLTGIKPDTEVKLDAANYLLTLIH
ncbi:TetR/AcrR family transcriptional regulator [Massilia cavernae]|uniref:TetR/AcrR family transcriptional regulator n=1 Tax=Massilia cavernae TaxID=2320864 RepID=A0A418XS89_9BURK|nr:TetR/AcrR family transcriptional regulator [Massilia cavernae]RJG15293.1 TetR/AcrR family transcriptional regulator [Massilia cavernae]